MDDSRHMLNSLGNIIKDVDFFLKLKDSAFALHASERTAWSKAQHSMAILENWRLDSAPASQADESAQAIPATSAVPWVTEACGNEIDALLRRIPAWKIAVRESALSATIFKALATIFCTIQEAIADDISFDDEVTNARLHMLLRWIRTAASLWTDIRFNVAMQRLQPVAESLASLTSINEHVNALHNFAEAEGVNNLSPVLKVAPATGVKLLIKNREDIIKVANAVIKLKDHIAQNWPNEYEGAIQCADKLVESQEAHWPHSQTDPASHVEALNKTYLDSVGAVKCFVQLRGYRISVTAYEGLGDIADARYRAQGSEAAINSMILHDNKFPSEGEWHNLLSSIAVDFDKVKELKEQALVHIDAHGNADVQAALPVLTDQSERLKLVAGGAVPKVKVGARPMGQIGQPSLRTQRTPCSS